MFDFELFELSDKPTYNASEELFSLLRAGFQLDSNYTIVSKGDSVTIEPKNRPGTTFEVKMSNQKDGSTACDWRINDTVVLQFTLKVQYSCSSGSTTLDVRLESRTAQFVSQCWMFKKDDLDSMVTAVCQALNSQFE